MESAEKKQKRHKLNTSESNGLKRLKPLDREIGENEMEFTMTLTFSINKAIHERETGKVEGKEEEDEEEEAIGSRRRSRAEDIIQVAKNMSKQISKCCSAPPKEVSCSESLVEQSTERMNTIREAERLLDKSREWWSQRILRLSTATVSVNSKSTSADEVSTRPSVSIPPSSEKKKRSKTTHAPRQAEVELETLPLPPPVTPKEESKIEMEKPLSLANTGIQKFFQKENKSTHVSSRVQKKEEKAKGEFKKPLPKTPRGKKVPDEIDLILHPPPPPPVPHEHKVELEAPWVVTVPDRGKPRVEYKEREDDIWPKLICLQYRIEHIVIVNVSKVPASGTRVARCSKADSIKLCEYHKNVELTAIASGEKLKADTMVGIVSPRMPPFALLIGAFDKYTEEDKKNETADVWVATDCLMRVPVSMLIKVAKQDDGIPSRPTEYTHLERKPILYDVLSPYPLSEVNTVDSFLRHFSD